MNTTKKIFSIIVIGLILLILTDLSSAAPHENYDCDFDWQCDGSLICEEQGDVSMSDGCCFVDENWNDNKKECNFAVYGTVYKTIINNDGTFNDTPYSNLKLVFKITDHIDGPIGIPVYNSITTDSNGNFKFNPEHGNSISGWNLNLIHNWQIDRIYAVNGNEVIGEWTNDYNNGFWWGEDSGYRIGTKTRHQTVRIHEDLPYWRRSDIAGNSISVSSLSSESESTLGEKAPNLIDLKIESNSSSNSLRINSLRESKDSLEIISVWATGNLTIKSNEEYTIKTNLPGGVKFSIDNITVLNEWQFNEEMLERESKIFLNEGVHKITLEYFDNVKSPEFYILIEDANGNNIFDHEHFIRTGLDMQYYKMEETDKSYSTFSKDYSISAASIADNNQNYQVSFFEGPEVYDPTVSYTITRTPLIFIHGIGGASGTWDDLYKEIHNSFDIWQFYYPNDQKVQYSSYLLKGAINKTLNNYNTNKVNVVAHSMGGLVSYAYIMNLSENLFGSKIQYNQNIDKIATLSTPFHGSHLANVISETTTFSTLCSSTEFLNNIRNNIFNGISDDSPAYRDISVGSELTYLINNKTIPNNITPIILGGTDEGFITQLCKEADDGNMDGIVSIASSSLLDRGFDLYTQNGDHSSIKVISASFLERIMQGLTPFTSSFENKVSNTDYGNFNEGAVLIKTINVETNVKIKSKITGTTFTMFRNSYNPKMWYYWGNNDEEGLTLPQGDYNILINDFDSGSDIIINPAQFNLVDMYTLSCIPNLVNSTWSAWQNISCLTNDKMNQTRTITQYDNNNCGLIQNSTFSDYRDTETCDYCIPNLVNTSWSSWVNISSCDKNGKLNQSRFLVQYDSNLCGEISNQTIHQDQQTDCQIFQLPINLTINNPKEGVYNDNSLVLNITSNIKASKIEFIDYSNSLPRWSTLCNNCDKYARFKSFKEGNHSMSIKLTNGTNIEITNVSFFIDSKDPQITRTLPRSRDFTNGSNFYIKYNEENCNSIALSIIGNTSSLGGGSSCQSGKNIERFDNLDLSIFENQEIIYNYTLTDIADNIDDSRVSRIKVDTISPNITYINYSIILRSLALNMTINETNFASVKYIDYNDLRPSLKTLCSSLRNNNCFKRIFLRSGQHNISINVLDKAGNSQNRVITFSIP